MQSILFWLGKNRGRGPQIREGLFDFGNQHRRTGGNVFERADIAKGFRPDIAGAGEADFIANRDWSAPEADCNGIAVRPIGNLTCRDDSPSIRLSFHGNRRFKVDFLSPGQSPRPNWKSIPDRIRGRCLQELGIELNAPEIEANLSHARTSISPRCASSPHQGKRLFEKLRTSEIAGFERHEQLGVSPPYAQERYPRIDFRADKKSLDTEAVDSCTRRLPARHDQTAHAGGNQALGDRGQPLFDCPAGNIPPIFLLNACYRVRLCA